MALLLFLWAATPAFADVTLLLGEPYGRYGRFNPTGHAAVYLSRVCSASPTVLRRCEGGETGVVISRYYRVAGVDWIAIPLMPFLYAVDRAGHVPDWADVDAVSTLRNQYRETYLRALVPDTPSGAPPEGTWIELVGAAYDRRLVAFTIETSEAQDDEFIRVLNSRPNKHRFNLLFRNCADFARDLVHLFYPKALRTNFIADLGVTTPKQIAKSLIHFARRRPDLRLTTFAIPQIPGSRSDSQAVRGVLESFVRSKKYLVPLALVQPWVPLGMAAGYVATGRFNPERYATAEYGPEALEMWARLATEPASTSITPDGGAREQIEVLRMPFRLPDP